MTRRELPGRNALLLARRFLIICFSDSRRTAIRLLSLICLTGILLSSAGLAADIKAGKKAAIQCNVCHGKNGIARNPEAPNLAGESAIYIEKQLVAFKRGERKHRQMSIIAKQLENKDIKNLAAWYAAMKVTVELPDLGE